MSVKPTGPDKGFKHIDQPLAESDQAVQIPAIVTQAEGFEWFLMGIMYFFTEYFFGNANFEDWMSKQKLTESLSNLFTDAANITDEQNKGERKAALKACLETMSLEQLKRLSSNLQSHYATTLALVVKKEAQDLPNLLNKLASESGTQIVKVKEDDIELIKETNVLNGTTSAGFLYEIHFPTTKFPNTVQIIVTNPNTGQSITKGIVLDNEIDIALIESELRKPLHAQIHQEIIMIMGDLLNAPFPVPNPARTKALQADLRGDNPQPLVKSKTVLLPDQKKYLELTFILKLRKEDHFYTTRIPYNKNESKGEMIVRIGNDGSLYRAYINSDNFFKREFIPP